MNWLEVFDTAVNPKCAICYQSVQQQNQDFHTLQAGEKAHQVTMLSKRKQPIGAYCAKCTLEPLKNENFIPALVEELKLLNQRWEKSNQLDESGFYLTKSPEYQEKVCAELRKICSRVTGIWEYLVEVSPESLKSLYFLEKVH